MDTETVPDDDPSVMVRQSMSELRLLKTGKYSDFTVVCGDRQWKVHKAILSKVPYFSAAVDGGFQESTQEKIIIEEFFEPFEIQWLLAYIYFPYFNIETARLETPNASKLETCVRLWQLGHYFQVKGMMEQAQRDMGSACKEWREIAIVGLRVVRVIAYLSDLECAIRRTWREDMASSPLLREKLTKLCFDFAPSLKHHPSFSTLLEEVPGFAVAFSQQALHHIMPTTADAVSQPNSEADESRFPISVTAGPHPGLLLSNGLRMSAEQRWDYARARLHLGQV